MVTEVMTDQEQRVLAIVSQILALPDVDRMIVAAAALVLTQDELRPVPADGVCTNCGAEAWQLVERVEQWHRGTFHAEDGEWSFLGNSSWDNVSDDGETLRLECRNCFTKYQVPDYDWL